MTFNVTSRSLLPALLLASLTAAAQGLPTPVDPVVNFDYVALAAAKPVTLRWRILNAGTAPFTATGAQSSSAALSAHWRNTPVEPGEYLLVEGSFVPAQHAAGRVAEQLLLKTDAGAPLRLTAVGTVLAAGEAAPAPARATPAADRGSTTYGYINGMGMEEIKPSFKSANKFANGRAAVQTRDGWGYINTKGEFVTDTKYAWCIIFHEGLGVVKDKNNKWGVVDLTGREVVPCQYDDISESFYHDGTLGVVKDGHGLLIDGYGRDLGLVKDPAVQEVTPLNGGVAMFKKDGKWGVLNAKGDVVLPPTYDAQKGGFRNGCALVSRGKLMGFIDATGREIVPCTFTTAKPFSEGKGIGAAETGPTHVYDSRGKELFTVATGELFEFHSGRALATAGPEADFVKSYIDATGKPLGNVRSTFAFGYSDGYAAIGAGMSSWAFLGWNGTGITSPDFDTLGEMALYEGDYGLASARSNTSRSSLSASSISRRQVDETVIAPAEGAAQLASTTAATLRPIGLPALAGQPAPPLNETRLAETKPAPAAAPATKSAAAKPAAKPMAPKPGPAKPAAKPTARK